MQPHLLPAINLQDYLAVNEATNQIHVAGQLLAKAGIAFVERQPDDSHSNLGWNQQNGFFYTHSLLAEKELFLCLDPANLRLLFLDQEENRQASFDLDGHDQATAVTWVKEKALQMGLPAADYPEELHYALPPYGNFDGRQFRKEPAAGFRAFSRLRSWGDVLLRELGKPFEHATAVRTWPHHFDHGMYIPLAFDDAGETCKAIGLGLAIHDSTMNEHYFYINHWRRNFQPDYSRLPGLPHGHWNTKDWVGAVLPCSKVIAMEDQERSLQAIRGFFATGIEASLNLIGQTAI